MDTLTRNKIIEELAQKATDAVDMDSLISFFYEAQYDYFDNLTDNDLMVSADDWGVSNV